MATEARIRTRWDLSLSLRFQGKQHVSDTFGDPAAPLDRHPERAARANASPPLGPDEPDELLRRQRSSPDEI